MRENNNFFTFDANGNIITQQRYEGSTLVDDLSYQYATNSAGDLLSNRLYSDGVIDYFTAYIISVSDYSPFGVELANRSWSIEEYRNGFDTQEKVPEIAPGHTTAMYWEYDARLGRRWQLDPVVKIWESGYATLNNNPIQLSDPRGDDAKDPIKIEVQSGDCLSKIANRYNTTIEAIKNANRSNIDWQKRGDKILAGETLYIPKPSTYSGNYAQTTASFQKW